MQVATWHIEVSRSADLGPPAYPKTREGINPRETSGPETSQSGSPGTLGEGHTKSGPQTGPLPCRAASAAGLIESQDGW